MAETARITEAGVKTIIAISSGGIHLTSFNTNDIGQNQTGTGTTSNIGYSQFYYDANGRLKAVYNPTATKQQLREYETDANGQIVQRRETEELNGWNIVNTGTDTFTTTKKSTATQAAELFRYYYDQNGNRIGEVNNSGQPRTEQDYVVQLQDQEKAEESTKNKVNQHKKFTPTVYFTHVGTSFHAKPVQCGY